MTKYQQRTNDRKDHFAWLSRAWSLKFQDLSNPKAEETLLLSSHTCTATTLVTIPTDKMNNIMNMRPAFDITHFKVLEDPIKGDFGPRPIASDNGHDDNTVDWQKFHLKFPEFEFFTEDMIDMDSDAFIGDEHYRSRASYRGKYYGPFVDIVAVVALTKKFQLQTTVTDEQDLRREEQIQSKVGYLTKIPEQVREAYKKIVQRWKGELGSPLWERSSYYDFQRCLQL